MVFFDVGANYGLYTFHAAKLVGIDGCVVAFEPQPRLCKALKMACSKFKSSNVEIVAAAASDHAGTTTFAIPAMASGTGSLNATHSSSDGATFSVETTTIDTVCLQRGITQVDLIKIDVEGAEYQALKGTSCILRSSQPLLWFELNPEAQQRAGCAIADIFRFLGDLGYESFYRISDGYPIVDPASEFRDLINVLAFPRGRKVDEMVSKLRALR
jgi:FkbM family methyltransferase